MTKRTFFVALGVPRGADATMVQVAYRNVVTRYRRQLEAEDMLDEPTEPPPVFAVLRTYSERRHTAAFEEPEPLIPPERAEVDRVFGGFVPEALPTPRARPEGKDLFVELRLGSEEAARGGLFPVHIPVVKACGSCAGGEEVQRITCLTCHGSGRVTEDRMVEVTVPPRVTHGQVSRLAMEDVGLGNTDLIVSVTVSKNRR